MEYFLFAKLNYKYLTCIDALINLYIIHKHIYTKYAIYKYNTYFYMYSIHTNIQYIYIYTHIQTIIYAYINIYACVHMHIHLNTYMYVGTLICAV